MTTVCNEILSECALLLIVTSPLIERFRQQSDLDACNETRDGLGRVELALKVTLRKDHVATIAELGVTHRPRAALMTDCAHHHAYQNGYGTNEQWS